MAHIYTGEQSRIDQDILNLARELPDEFWVFAEFNVGRNIDWFMVRAASLTPSVLIMTELKRLARPLEGQVDSPWRMQTDAGEWQEIEPSNGRDLNYYWQAVNSANTLAEWLWNNQQRYRESAEVRPLEDFKVWPDLLLLSPPGTFHRLPLGPASRYGRWWYNARDWWNHVVTWKPKFGVALGERELTNLAGALGLQPLPGEPERPAEPAPEAPGELLTFFTWLRGLEERISRLEALLPADGRPEGTARGLPPRPRPRPAPPAPAEPAPRPPARPWSDEEREALADALAELRGQGRSRALPAVIEMMNLKLGYRLQDRNYNGYGGARAMFDQARADGLLQYGPLSGPNPTVYLPDEALASS